MRGKVCSDRSFQPGPGITPAYAGKSLFWLHRGTLSQDHPRVCGEKTLQPDVAQLFQGSPPRMRGKAERLIESKMLPRITPAYAGKSFFASLMAFRVEDHPRVCGEKSISISVTTSCKGSPPRMRGKARQRLVLRLDTRITPAYAGKRVQQEKYSASIRDHPRVCGEKTRASGPDGARKGSPPRMRGKGLKDNVDATVLRITPAYAGKRAARPSWSSCAGDHPRVCGEKTKKIP